MKNKVFDYRFIFLQIKLFSNNRFCAKTYFETKANLGNSGMAYLILEKKTGQISVSLFSKERLLVSCCKSVILIGLFARNPNSEKLGDKVEQMKDEMVNLGERLENSLENLRLQSGKSDEKGLL